MKVKLFLFLFVLSFNVFSENVKIDLKQATVKDFVNLTYLNILHKSVVFYDIDDDQFFDVSVTIDKNYLQSFVNNFLIRHDLIIQELNNVFIFAKNNKKDVNLRFYVPKYQSVEFLSNYLSSVFPDIFSNKVASKVKDSSDASKSLYTSNSTNVSTDKKFNVSETSNNFNVDNNNSNILLFSCDDNHYNLILPLLQAIDVKSEQRTVEIVLFEVINNSNKLTTYDLLLNIFNSKLKIGTSNVSSGILSFSSHDFNSVVSYLNTDNHFKEINNTKVILLNHSTARIQVGQDVPINTGTIQNINGNLQTIEYKKVGILLNFTLDIFSNINKIQLNQEISSIASNSLNPIIESRNLATVFNVYDNETVTLFGVNDKKENDNKSYFPFLSFLFNSDSKIKYSDELLIMIKLSK